MANMFLKPVQVNIDGSDKPAPIRDPMSGKRLDPAGEWKPKTQFWIRRVLQGDVIETIPAPAQVPAAPSSSAS